MRRFAVLVATAFIALTGTAAAQDLHATPSTLASVYASAQGGDNVLLSSGSYGAFNGGAKSSIVTVKPETGASVTMAGSDYGSSVRNLTIQGITYTGPIEIVTASGVDMHLTFDGITMANVGHAAHEGRMSITGPGTPSIDGNGVQIKNSTFGPGGCSDGIQESTKGTEIGPNNEFKGIVQGSCTEHADAIQPYDSNYVHIHDNNLHDNEQGIMAPDGPSTGWLIENNVIHTTNAYPTITLGHTINGIVRHNVSRNGNIRVYGGNEGVPSSGMVIQDNVGGVNNDSCSGCTVSNNPPVSSVTFTGGSGRCAYATASPKGTATDGTDVGLNDCGGTPPPPNPACSDGVDNDGDGFIDFPADAGCTSASDTDETDPIGPPPTDHTPVAVFTDSLNPSAPGQSVTFNGTGSTCQDTPCTYYWHDIGAPNGTADYPIGPPGGGPTVSQTFQGLGIKYVELVLTDADGDVNKVMHQHTVSNTQPPPDTTAPQTTITSAPSDGTSTSASVSFTANETSTFECKLDAGAFAACTSPKSYTGLAVGSHTVSVRATDTAGNVDATPATATWNVNATPPPTNGPPVFKDEHETAWNTSGNKSVSVPVVAGDVLVAYAGTEDAAYPLNNTLGGSGLTWTLKQSGTTRAPAYVWTATATTTTTATVTTTANGAGHGGLDVLRFGNSTGIGATNKSLTSSVSLTTTKDSSAIVKFVTDWNAAPGGSRSSLTAGVGAFTETTYFLDAGRYTIYGGYHANVGAIGSKTVGYSAPSGMSANSIGVEVLGT